MNLNTHPLLRKILLNYDIWIVGTGMSFLRGISETDPKDFDVICNENTFKEVLILLCSYGFVFEVNSFGGIKAKGPFVLDIWVSSIEDYAKTRAGGDKYKTKRAYSFKESIEITIDQ